MTGLTEAEEKFVSFITTKVGATKSDFSKEFGMHNEAVVVLLESLEKRNLISINRRAGTSWIITSILKEVKK